MIAKAPLWAHIMWLAVVFTPFCLPIFALLLGLRNKVLFILLIFVAFVAADYIYLSLIRHTRRRVNQSLIRGMALQEQRPFVLMSRGYAQAQRYEFQHHQPLVGGISGTISLFDALVWDISNSSPVLAIGDKDVSKNDPSSRALFVCTWPDPGTSNRLVFDEEAGSLLDARSMSWEELFVLLAKEARFVIVIPSDSEGVRRELDLLRINKLTSKVILYMWPARGPRRHPALSASPESWNSIRGALTEVGLQLPEHQQEGALIRINSDLTVSETISPIAVNDVLGHLLRESIATGCRPLREFAPELRSLEIAGQGVKYGEMWGGKFV